MMKRRIAMLAGLVLGCVVLVPVAGWALEEADLQQFIEEAIKAGGGEVVIPPGEHVLRMGLKLVDAKGVRIAGIDNEDCVLRWEGEAGGSLIKVSGVVEQVSIGKLTLRGNGKAGFGVKVEAKSGVGLRVEDSLFAGGLQGGVSLEGVEGVVVERCSFRDLAGAAIELGAGVASAEVAGNWVIRCGAGLKVSKGVVVYAGANEFVGLQEGLLVEAGGQVKELEEKPVKVEVKSE